jgi:hypothetical protein
LLRKLQFRCGRPVSRGSALLDDIPMRPGLALVAALVIWLDSVLDGAGAHDVPTE